MSTAIVLAVIAIVMVVWLPGRTRDSMRRVVEHRQDRYSPSLHLIDERSGTRFSDERTPTVKGVLMQPTRTVSPGPTRKRIAEVRRRRREAIRRRRVLTSALLGLGVAVLVSARIWAFAPWWSLVFFLPLLAVVALGARASAHARRWEDRVRTLRDVGRTSAMTPGSAGPGSRDSGEVGKTDVGSGAHPTGDDSPTATLAARQIRQALRRSAEERDRRTKDRRVDSGIPASLAATKSEESVIGYASASDHASAAGADSPAMPPNRSQTPDRSSARPRVPDVSAATSGGPASDETNELVTIHPAAPLDAFDMAVSGQDLISFSLGEAPGDARSGSFASDQGPQSLEIRSTRQVSRAVPGGRPVSSPDPESDESTTTVPATAAVEEPESGYESGEDFHRTEMEAPVEAPPVTGDSLGPAIESILSRRSA
ncbi:hypothetical protein [uncultured Bifidobacterium sp.]|uniref:hypothetical protein n=1 Tax=uncultured Bifidobacterium sp. TaxID=165187 RepID=UPI0028DCDE1D|nr:hypothetical protein [uncultured Bifidobacterium sp.]